MITIATGKTNPELDDSLSVPKTEPELNIIAFDANNSMDINSWLEYFEKVCLKMQRDDQWKIRNFSRFVRGDALSVYIRNCHRINTFAEFVTFLKEKFFTPTLPN